MPVRGCPSYDPPPRPLSQSTLTWRWNTLAWTRCCRSGKGKASHSSHQTHKRLSATLRRLSKVWCHLTKVIILWILGYWPLSETAVVAAIISFSEWSSIRPSSVQGKLKALGALHSQEQMTDLSCRSNYDATPYAIFNCVSQPVTTGWNLNSCEGVSHNNSSI